jgi:hydroxymethylglutaryl-CoA synthase
MVEGGTPVSTGPVKPVAVLGMGAAAPSLRLAAADVGAAWGSGGGRGAVAVCDADEDTLTLAWQAANTALGAAGVDAADVSGLWWGTGRPPFAEGPSHAFFAATLGLGRAGGGALVSGSPHAGMEALLGAWDAIAAGHARLALVVVSDALVPGLGTAGETTTGAGAAAVVLGAVAETSNGPSTNGSSPPARLVARTTRAMPAVDRYRADGGGATGDVYDPRLFREEVFVPLLTETGRAAVEETSGPIGSWAIADPDGKLASAVAKRLGAPLASAGVFGALGDAGAASALVGLVHACAASGSDASTVGMMGYGGGRATAVVVEAVRAVPGALTVDRLGPGRRVTYPEALRARGQLEPMDDPIAMGVPPGGSAFVRGNPEMLGLFGARCRACGTISTPPSIHPICIGCGGAQLEVVSLARRGRVHTFVVNQTMPPPFQAPLPLVVIDLEDGARLMAQGTPADAADLAVGDEVELSLRRYALERGIPVYGYKAFRVAGIGAKVGSGPDRTVPDRTVPDRTVPDRTAKEAGA